MLLPCTAVFSTAAVFPHCCYRHVAVHYRGQADGGRNEQGNVVLYTATDPVNGGLCPYSQAVIMALLEKKVPFREIKVQRWLPATANTSCPMTEMHPVQQHNNFAWIEATYGNQQSAGSALLIVHPCDLG